jgi:hypothetical protein
VFAIIFWVWISCAIIGIFVGRSRGRSAYEGCLMGLFLGPIGLLMMAIGPDYSPSCPYCKGTIIDGATRCKNCGQLLPLEAEH